MNKYVVTQILVSSVKLQYKRRGCDMIKLLTTWSYCLIVQHKIRGLNPLYILIPQWAAEPCIHFFVSVR